MTGFSLLLWIWLIKDEGILIRCCVEAVMTFVCVVHVGGNISKMLDRRGYTTVVKGKLTELIQKLNDGGYVHGDFRPREPNILVIKKATELN